MQKEKNNNDISRFDIKSKLPLILFFLFLFVGLIIFYKPMAIDGQEPRGVDNMKNLGETTQVKEFEEENNTIALWNPEIFIGIPRYFSRSNNSFNFNLIINTLNHNNIIDWRVSWLFLGAIGMFLLLRSLGLAWYISAIGSIAFIFWPHMQGLIEVGHNAKVRAICAMPLVIFAFFNFVKKKDLISILWFSLIFSLILRTQHYQIIFYTLFILLGVGIYHIIKWIRAKEFINIKKTVPIFILSLLISILMSAQPLFLAKEYTPYSTRGGKAIDLSEKSSQQQKTSGGVGLDYATRWSFSPKEVMSLISPKFFGGTSAEKYNGKTYPHLRNKTIQGTYWGDMPFTQSSEYIGIVIVVLAVFGVWMNRKNGLVITFFILAMFSMFLSFGRHFPTLYKLFFYYVPYFDKFRAPVMTLILFTFNVIILSMFGLKSLLEIKENAKLRSFLFISCIFLFVGILFILIPDLLSFSSEKDVQFGNNSQVLEMYKTIRKEMMVGDTIRMVLYLSLLIVSVIVFNLHLLFNREKLQQVLSKLRLDGYFNWLISDNVKWPLILSIFLLISIDAISVSYRFISNAEFFNVERAEKRYFKKTDIDKIIDQDKEYNRVIELGSDFTSNDLAYHHQIIGGYSAIKPQAIQDIVSNNLYSSNDPLIPVNIPVISMMNGKYIITPGIVNHPDLKQLIIDQQKQKILYENLNTLPRAYFISTTKKLKDEKEVVRFLNSPLFKPDSIAVFSNEILTENNYSTEGTVAISEYNPNQIELTASTPNNAFLILAEAYYPKGWECKIDGKSTGIFQMNHVLRGIEVPKGKHLITFNFEPKSYKRSTLISAIFTYCVWLLIIAFYIKKFIKMRKDREN